MDVFYEKDLQFSIHFNAAHCAGVKIYCLFFCHVLVINTLETKRPYFIAVNSFPAEVQSTAVVERKRKKQKTFTGNAIKIFRGKSKWIYFSLAEMNTLRFFFWKCNILSFNIILNYQDRDKPKRHFLALYDTHEVEGYN